MKVTPRSIALLLGALLPLHAQAARVVTTADVGIGTDDNLLSARDGSARKDDQSLQVGIAAAWSEALQPGFTLRLLARLDGKLHTSTSGLNELAIGADGQLLLRPGSGFYTPTFGVSAGLGSSQFQSSLRDAQEGRAQIFLRQALTTRLSTRSSVFALWRGSDSAVFDTHIYGADAAVDWQVRPALVLTLGYQYRDGKVVSIGTPSATALANASAVQMDDVFTGQPAFSFPAQTHVGMVGANYALTPNLSLDAQLRYVESDSRFGTRYHRWTTITGLIARF